jgi:A/G-specific adenine glycosylase
VVRQEVLTPLQRDLLDWGERARRDLPWRRTRDPWAVLVSELMLQQTQAPRVVPKFEVFLERFPTVGDCAAASVGEIVDAWHGLGYNRRAVNLHRAAVVVAERHGGVVPDDLDALLALPGIGPYTARAVLVFAFERDIGLVDTNAGRFVARALAGHAVTAAEGQRLADGAVPAGEAWAWGQAVFDLGAAVCTKRAPACDRCPVVDSCAWAHSGWPPSDPAIGSAGVSTGQSPFAGSFRQGRGRLVSVLRSGPIAPGSVAVASGWPDDAERAARAVASLVADGLAVVDAQGTVSLP